MAKLLTCVLTTFQLATADLKADVFGLEVFVRILLLSSPLSSFLLSRTAVLAALMPSAVELGLADTEAHWGVDVALMTYRVY